QWPAVRFKDKRAITLAEHQKIIAAEVNPERKTLYQLCWHLGASQGDIANLKGEDVDWTNGTVSFTRKKTGVPVIIHLGSETLNLFKDLGENRTARAAYLEKAVLPAMTGQGYENLAIQEGGAASREFLRVTFGKVDDEERRRVRQQLHDYCGLDTMGMVQIVRELAKF